MRPRRNNMKKTAFVFLLVGLGLLIIEAMSSLLLYRYYAHIPKAFEPAGSATFVLARGAYDKVRGVHREVHITADHGPVFDASDTLGFTTIPGRYKVTENYDGKKHFFELNVEEGGRRSTSYFAVQGSKRLIVLGDSAIFGWGLDDEQTMPWLLQSKLPDVEVVNLSMTSYSTIHALLQLQQLESKIVPDDIVVIAYHPLTNDFNVATPGMLRQLTVGFESQLADPKRLLAMNIPFGAIYATGALVINHISLACVGQPQAAGCARPLISTEIAERVTQLAFDKIEALHTGHLVIAFVSGPDKDPVIAHLKSQGLTIADLRTVDGYPEKTDVIATDLHSGAFWHHQIYSLLLRVIEEKQLVHARPIKSWQHHVAISHPESRSLENGETLLQ